MIRLIELFAGYGSQHEALKLECVPVEVVALAEWFVPAIIAYERLHGNLDEAMMMHRSINRDGAIKYLESLPLSWDSKTLAKPGFWKRFKDEQLKEIYLAVVASEHDRGNRFDVNHLVEGLPQSDLLTYSFPCQDLSHQGKKAGMQEGSGTRSSLLWTVGKILQATAKENLPARLLMENVPAVLEESNRVEWERWCKFLEDLGYKNTVQVLNAADFGSPQVRKRAFMISSLEDVPQFPDKFPIAADWKLGDIQLNLPADGELTMKVVQHLKIDSVCEKMKSGICKLRLVDAGHGTFSNFNAECYAFCPEGKGPTLTSTGANSRIKLQVHGGFRYITAQEAYMYMGLSARQAELLVNHGSLSTNQHLHLAGNSISIEPLRAIIRKLYKGESND